MSDLVFVSLILLCLLLEALFSGAEIALVASDIHKIRSRARGGSRSAALALKLLNKPEWFLATTLTGTDVCIVVSTTLATTLFISAYGMARGEFIAVLVMVPLLLVFGEIIPKSIFQQHAEAMAVRLARFIWISSWILYPLVLVISKISRGAVFLIMGVKGEHPYTYITKDGLKFLLADKGRKGDVRQAEQEMVGRVIDFSEAKVGQAMAPLSNVAALDVNTKIGEAARIIDEKGYSRLPVYRDHIINVIGIVHAFDVLKGLPESAGKTIESCYKPYAFYVPEMKSAGELLKEMQLKGEQIAVVVDEYGGAVGIITIEDILEEIVGEIEDEYDKGQKMYKPVGPGRYLFNTRLSIDRAREILPVEIPEGDYETLGGWLLTRMGRIPRRSETYTHRGAVFVIEDADVKSIREVLLILPQGMDLRRKPE